MMSVLTSDWQSSRDQLKFVRHQVFVIEHGIDEQDEWDEKDAVATHFVAFGTTAVPVGVCRLTEDGQIGRLAVLPSYRQQGYGKLLLRKAIQVAREMSLNEVYLNAMVDVQAFYHAHGFESDGLIFMEAGKPHIKMIRKL